MTEQLEKVLDAVQTIGRIEELKVKVAGVLAVAMQQFVSTIVKAASDVFQDDYKVRDFETRIRELLEARPTALGFDGTALTPDMDVTEMDATVPKEE